MLSVDQLHWLLTFLKFSASYIVSTSLREDSQIQGNCSFQGQPIPGSGGQLAWNIPSVCRQANPWPHPNPHSYSTFPHQASTSSALSHPRVRCQTVRESPYAPKSTRIIQTSNPRLCPLPCLASPMKTPKIILLYILICLIYTDFSIYQMPFLQKGRGENWSTEGLNVLSDSLWR